MKWNVGGAVLAALVCLTAQGARADQARLITAIAGRDAKVEPEALEVWHALDERLRKDARFQPVELEPRAELASERARREKLETGRKLIVKAREEYKANLLSSASTNAERAWTVFSDAPLESYFDEVVKARAFNVMLLVAIGDIPTAELKMRQLFAEAPDVVFEQNAIVRLRELAQAQRQALSYAPHIALEIRSHPVSGLVYVDGRFRGASPLTVTDLAPGPHFVTVLAPGFEVFQDEYRTLDKLPSGEDSVEVTLIPTPKSEAVREWLGKVGGSVSLDALTAAGLGLARAAHAQEALVASLSEEGEKLRVLAVRVVDGPVPAVVSQTVTVADEAEAVEVVAGLLEQAPSGPGSMAMAAPAPVAAASVSPSPPSGNGGGGGKVLGTVALGAGAVAAVVGGVFGYSALQQSKAAWAIPQTSHDEFDRAYSGAQRSAVIANSLYAVGAASAGIGAWLLLTSNEPGPRKSAVNVSVNLMPFPSGGAVFMEGRFQ